MDPAAIAVALERLAEQGVVHLEDEQIRASACARHLDALGFICIYTRHGRDLRRSDPCESAASCESLALSTERRRKL